MTVFSTLLALEENGEIILGVSVLLRPMKFIGLKKVKAPGEMDSALKYQLARIWVNLSLILAVSIESFREVSLRRWKRLSCRRQDKDVLVIIWVLLRFLRQSWSQSRKLASNPGFSPHEIIIEEAGGTFSDMAGGKSIYLGDCLVTNGHLEKAFTDLLKVYWRFNRLL